MKYDYKTDAAQEESRYFTRNIEYSEKTTKYSMRVKGIRSFTSPRPAPTSRGKTGFRSECATSA
jgi:hypothetical protein